MNILKIIPGLPTPYDPNRMMWLKDYIEYLAKDHSVKVIIIESLIHYLKPRYFKTWLKEKAFPEFISDNPNIELIPVRFFSLPGLKGYKKFTYPLILKKVLKLTEERIDMKNINLIHCQFVSPVGDLSYQLAKKYQKPYIISVLESDFSYAVNTGVNVINSMEAADQLVSITTTLEEDIKKLVNYPDTKMNIIPMGTDFSRFSLPAKENSLKKKPKLLFVAGLIKHKGCDFLLQAIRKLDNEDIRCTLDIVGVGEEMNNLKNLTRELNLEKRVNFLGKLAKHEDLTKLYQGCDIFVLPSLAEGQGVVIIEALACGKPVVSTYCGGPETIITELVGELAQKADADDLARAIGEVVNKYSSYNANKIREYAFNKYSLEAMANAINNLYKKTVSAFRK